MVSAVVVVAPVAARPMVLPVAITIMIPTPPVIPLSVLPSATLVIPRLFRCGLLAAVLLLLPFLVVHEIIEDGRGVTVRVHYPQHLQAFGVRHLLRVPGVCHWLVVVVLQPDVTQLHVGHVFHVYPTHLREERDFSIKLYCFNAFYIM